MLSICHEIMLTIYEILEYPLRFLKIEESQWDSQSNVIELHSIIGKLATNETFENAEMSLKNREEIALVISL